MTDNNNNNNSPPRTRRSSFAGNTFADIFGTGRSSMARSNAENNSPPGPITTAAAQAQRRRLSLTTLGLGNSNTQAASFGGYRGRNDSLGSADNSIDECAVEDDAGAKDATPSTPFARRVSFGARAMMDIRTGSGSSPNQQNGRSPPASLSNSGSSSARAPSVGTISTKGRGRSLSQQPKHCFLSNFFPFHNRIERRSSQSTSADFGGIGSVEGFNWSDNLRTRAERTSNASLAGLPAPSAASHQRAKSVAIMEPPIREAPREPRRPDHFQERILKGDFYMD